MTYASVYLNRVCSTGHRVGRSGCFGLQGKPQLTWLRQYRKVLFHRTSILRSDGLVESVAKSYYGGFRLIPSFCSAISSVLVTGWLQQLQATNPHTPLSRGRTKGSLSWCLFLIAKKPFSEVPRQMSLPAPLVRIGSHASFTSYHQGK